MASETAKIEFFVDYSTLLPRFSTSRVNISQNVAEVDASDFWRPFTKKKQRRPRDDSFRSYPKKLNTKIFTVRDD